MSDLINREKAMESVARHYHQETGCEGGWFSYIALADVPSADLETEAYNRGYADAVETLKGEPREVWIVETNKYERRWICSNCKEWQTYGATKYCPNCGSRMRIGADDE